MEVKLEKKDHILFTLTIPKFNTWNNRWTGEGRKYTRSEAKDADKKSEGFLGYEWMIDQLKETGDIVMK